jgi:dolichol-phosphate mannosyltransferase
MNETRIVTEQTTGQIAQGPAARTLITIATYNEIENLPSLAEAIFAEVPQVDLLVVDDASPDGTGQWCDQKSATDSRVHCLHRAGKLGLGTATIAAMRFAIEHGYDLVLNMDADFSHHPRHLPALLTRMEAADVMIGSRYVAGGAVKDWPLKRRLMSWGVNTYARLLLGLSSRDNSGAFRCYRVALLKQIDFDAIRSRGYSFQEEILWLLKRAGARVGETPIQFADRERGQSKINSREALAALWIIFRLGVKNWFGL